jgi:hypothetical protein
VTDDAVPERQPSILAADVDRQAVVVRLQAAVGEGRLDLEESGQGASAAHAVVMMAELDALVADLPREASPQIVGTRTPEVVSSVFGDIKVSGGTVPRRASTVFGDVDVILAEGVDGELHGRTVFGALRLRSLAPGESPSRWKALLDRLARSDPAPLQPPVPPPPVPPPGH